VSNLGVQRADPVLLMLDDDPEYVRVDGVLFRGTVDASKPVRLYYYHANVGTPRRYLLVLAAAGGDASRVQVIDASAGPNADVMSVGHAVSRSFIQLEPQNEGTVVDLPTGAPFLQRDVPAAPSEGVAGAVDVRVLMGGAVTMTVLAIPTGADPAAFLGTPKVPGDGHERHGTFDLTRSGQTTIAYTVGGPDASFEYGSRARSPQNVDPNDSGSDAGEYGVLQRITFDLANPLATPATVYLYEQPVGGVVRNSFSIDGTIFDVGCARLSQRYQIASYQLDPKGTRALNVLTMTDGGSNYPLEIGVTATPPLPTTPPLNAPDGCFPKPGATTPPPTASPAPGASAPTARPTVPPPPTPVPTSVPP
jgi:hypothetical protein